VSDPLAASAIDDPVDVAIVGLGPVGAAAACLLAQRGLTVAAFEREKSVYHMPRAAHFDAEIMRVWQAIGLTDALASCTTHIPGMHLVNAEGRKLLGFDTSVEVGPLGWPPDTMFHQPDLETALRGRARELGVAMHLGWEAVDIDPGRACGGEVRVLLRNVDGGAERAVRARWLLGCDGARSLVRSAIGGALEDLRCDQPWLVVDVILKRPVELPRVAVQYCDPARPATFVPMPGARRRWEFMLMPGDTRESMERPERVRELVAPWVRPEDVEVERAVVYTFHACLAAPWRKGRLFLLGDAAHQMPPFLGQGMCAGVRDAANLSWKLDLVARGLAAEALLDSYERERSPHVRAVIDLAVRTGGIIQTTDPALAAVRDAHFLGPDAPSLRPEPLPSLADGIVRAGDPSAGRVVPQPRDETGARLDDRLGPGFAIVCRRDPRGGMREESLRFWDRLGARFVATGALDIWLASHGATAVVVRPDRYAFGAATGAHDLDAVTDDLRARLERP